MQSPFAEGIFKFVVLGGPRLNPLALRLFARSMPAELAGDPTRLWQQVFDAPHLAGDDSMAGQMQRLLTFYEQRLALGHMIYYLARLLVTESALWLGRGDHAAALGACERVRELAAPRNYGLVHADARRARDDAEAALQLAQFCNCAWAQRDATELLADAYRLLGQPQESARYQTETDRWPRRLTRPG